MLWVVTEYRHFTRRLSRVPLPLLRPKTKFDSDASIDCVPMLELTTRFICRAIYLRFRLPSSSLKVIPVISIDGDGKVHALRKGKVTITGEFGGMRDRVVAIVQ
jgi:hypothetical protein